MDYSKNYCSLCNREFKHRRNLYRHNRECHSNGHYDHQYPVTTCGKVFGRKYALTQHMKKDHSYYDEPEPVFVTIKNDMYSDISDEEEENFGEFFTNYYSPVSNLSLTSLEETMETLINPEEDEPQNHEVNPNYEEEDVSDLEDPESSDDLEREEEAEGPDDDFNRTETVELMCINLSLKRFQHTYADGHQSIERETGISYSKGLIPEEIDFSEIATNIINEVPEHLNNLRNRFVSAEIL